MLHRHLNSAEWTPMAVESLFDRGDMADWQEFTKAPAKSKDVARYALTMSEAHEDEGSAALARILVMRFHPELLAELTRNHSDSLPLPPH